MIHFLLVAVLSISTIAASGQTERRPRVFIEESTSWEVEGDPVFSSTDKKGRVHVSGGSTRGGAKPRTAEIIKRFNEQCKSCIITMYKDKADFIVLLEHEGGKDLFDKDNKLAVFNREGDLVTSGSFSRPKKAVDVACQAIAVEFGRQPENTGTGARNDQ